MQRGAIDIFHNQEGATRYNLNDTMPVGSAAGVGGLGSSSLNMIRQSSLENGIKFTSGGLIANTGVNNTILSNMNTNNGDRT